MRVIKIKKLKNRLSAFVLAAILCLMTAAMSAYAEDTADSSKKVVRVSCGVNNALYLDSNGKPAGYLVYYVAQLAYINNWKLEYVEGSWKDSVQNLYDGKIDLLFPTQQIDDRMNTMAFSQYIGGYQPIALFANKDAEIYYNDFSSFNNKRIAITENSSNEQLLEDYAEKNNFSYVTVNLNSTKEKLDALENGTVDMIVFSTLNDVPNSKIIGLLDYLPFYFSTRIDDDELIAEVNYGMRKIWAENPNVASDVYDSFLNGSSPLSFTREENETIRSTASVRVGIFDDSLPLSGRDEDGKPIGIYVDLLGEIENNSGIHIEPVLISRRESLYSELKTDNVDFVIGSKSLAYNEEDVSSYMCSESIMDYITVAITRAGYAFAQSDSPSFIITNARKYWENDILALYPNARISYGNDVKECLVAVQEGKADATLINTWEYNYQSKNARFSGMVEWENLRRQTDLVLGVKKGTDSNLLSIMEKSIDRVAGSDKDTIIAKNLNMPYTSYDLADYWYGIKNVVYTGGIIFLVLAAGVLFLISIRRRYMKQLEEKNEQLQKANAAKDNFLSRMSHELRTPLNAITGYAAIMQQNVSAHRYDEAKVALYVESILRAGKYQLALIGDLLDIQKIESGKMELVPSEVDLGELLNGIVAMIEPEAEEKGVQFSYDNINKWSCGYYIDGVQFEKVLLGLLHNAVKFTGFGGKVKLTGEVVDQNETTNVLKFVVSDTGIGMSEDFQQNYLFHRFTQEYKGNTSPYEGCGTGLANARDIMHLMGGEISCESRQGVGSSFTVIMTAKRIEKKRRRASKIDYSAYDLSGIRVLLCEDNAMNQDIERRILEKMNCKVDIAEDGRLGVEMFERSTEGYYNIVLMDIRMPNMDGLEASQTIRSMNREDAKKIPIVAVSANSFEEDIKKSLDAGMNEHLSKPVDIKVLYEKISLYCKK